MQRRQGIDAHDRLMELLAGSSSLAFKVWKLSRTLRITGKVLLVMLALAYLAGCVKLLTEKPTIFRPASLGAAGLAVAGILVATATLRNLRFPGVGIAGALLRVTTGLGMGLLGWIAAWIHLAFFDPWYLRLGKAEHLEFSRKEQV
jgi:hypothetical protein